MLGNLDRIACPYCDLSIVLGVDGFCCQPMSDIAAVLLDGMESRVSGAKGAEESTEPRATEMDIFLNGGDLVQ